MTSENTVDTLAASVGVTVEFTESYTSVIVHEDGTSERRAARLRGETGLATRARILSGYFHESTDEFTTLKAIERAENAGQASAEPVEDFGCELGCTDH